MFLTPLYNPADRLAGLPELGLVKAHLLRVRGNPAVMPGAEAGA